jgi:hypothetical protein
LLDTDTYTYTYSRRSAWGVARTSTSRRSLSS